MNIKQPKPILYYTILCPSARACMITAKLINFDVDLRFVDYVKNEHLSEEFLKINPQHQVPVFIDENEPYYDSHAIMAYMVSKYAKSDSLYPKDLSKRAKVDHKLHFENGVLFTVLKDFVNRTINGDETVFNQKPIKNCHSAYEFLEKFLENQNYVVGSELTIADISINTTLITLHRLIPVEKEKYPNIVAWMERLRTLPDNETINEEGATQLANRIHSFMVANKSNA